MEFFLCFLISFEYLVWFGVRFCFYVLEEFILDIVNLFGYILYWYFVIYLNIYLY